MTFVVGLTGGIGSGKSTVAELFVERGAALVDTDMIAHELTAPNGAAMTAIAAAFGPIVVRPDGGLDRSAMRRLAFSDPTAKARLEAILHPLIRDYSEARCTAPTSAPYVLLAVPLLIETGSFRKRTDRVLVVDCEETIQVARVMARSGLTEPEVKAIMATQASRSKRREIADDLVLNSAGMDDLPAQVDSLHGLYRVLARAKLHADR
ncbi:MAG TPA: dephospho-CoA kinase [Accumulibacter sp.]|uniref:dephospho-CoA kinase n=1 Tax=Accumulibacter sp. TaxID=2053492 RepID=UPI00287AFC08|nr:dephospho-CoA kinase [Accumulibacter sp.]MDS4055105.1 dephospho-CoA kinase [Accumulibacter sp.]HMV05501.1 dephospho-CoA kinase [Accumulibacter sp.]HMW64113.1 dephospho-CoA kinase [Accumulibacter sp.]HMW80856.1 dephospho-CoA kinase [Accumulibacter sp.]HMX70074.1 dephospho-CoA kinase [Accumulibacter sp.]